MKDIECQIAREVGLAIKHYYEIQGEDKAACYRRADETIRNIRFSSIRFQKRWFTKDEIIITCANPGCLIGPYGKTYGHLEWVLKQSSNPLIAQATIKIVEDKLLCHLMDFMIERDLEDEFERELYEKTYEEDLH